VSVLLSTTASDPDTYVAVLERVRRDPERWFWRRVQKTESCWIWSGAHLSSGYGLLSYGPKGGQRSVLAHRISYILAHGPIPQGLVIDHLCQVKNCVRPSHMQPVTRGENTLRGNGVVAQHARKMVCVRGHDFSGGNLYMYRGIHRQCRTCHRKREAQRRRK
jgi:hypothetical protein